jgi:hypothetical protein
MVKSRVLILILSLFPLAGCSSEKAAQPAPSGSAPVLISQGRRYVDTQGYQIATVEDVSDESVVLLPCGQALPVRMSCIEFTKRFIPLDNLESGTWVGPQRDVVVRFSKLQAARLRDPYHVPGDLWFMEDGEPRHLLKSGYQIPLALLFEQYSRNHELASRILAHESSQDERLSELRSARMLARIQDEIDALKSNIKLAATGNDQNPGAEYETPRPGPSADSKRLLDKMGIHGEGWYVHAHELREFAQVVSVLDIRPKSICFRLWRRSPEGSWEVQSQEAAPLVFATTYKWCLDLPGLYATESRDKWMRITVDRAVPPSVKAWSVDGGTQQVTSELDSRLALDVWERFAKHAPEPCPSSLTEHVAKLRREGRVWIAEDLEKPASASHEN